MPSARSADAIGLEELRDRIDIVEVVSAYVPTLRHRGREWLGLCPFHDEKTASFYVIPHQRRYYCFGCRASGDAIKFVQEIDKLSFVEAADSLARRLGRRFHGRETREERSLRDRLHEVNGVAAEYFHDLFRNSDRADGARRYVEGRGFGKESVSAFQVGYSLPEWEALRKTLVSRGHPEGILLQAGLLKERESGDGAYDRFRGRLMFPIRSAQGDVVAFGGRALGDDEPKYLNSPGTPVFDKGRTFYGLDRAADQIKRTGEAVVVEGYTDVVSCHQAGRTNVVATLGTALTGDHLRVLARYARAVVLSYDADSAGLAAMLRSAGQLEASDLEIKVAVLRPGEDPDSLIRSGGADAFGGALSEARPLYHFVLDMLIPEPGRTPSKEQIERVVEALTRLEVPMLREQYIVYASDRLCLGDPGRMAGMAEALRRQVRSSRRSAARRSASSDRGSAADAEHVSADAVMEGAIAKVPVVVRRREEAVLAALAQQTVSPKEVFERLSAQCFVDAVNRELAERIGERLRMNTRALGPEFVETLSEAAAARWTMLALGDLHSARDRESVDDCVDKLLEGAKRRRLEELERAVPELLALSKRDERDEAALREYQELRRFFSERTGRDTAGPPP